MMHLSMPKHVLACHCSISFVIFIAVFWKIQKEKEKYLPLIVSVLNEKNKEQENEHFY